MQNSTSKTANKREFYHKKNMGTKTTPLRFWICTYQITLEDSSYTCFMKSIKLLEGGGGQGYCQLFYDYTKEGFSQNIGGGIFVLHLNWFN